MCDTDSSRGTCARADLPKASLWLVDGFNALHAVLLGGEPRSEWWTAPQRERLIERASRFCDAGAEVWVVFDGPHATEVETVETVETVEVDEASGSRAAPVVPEPVAPEESEERKESEESKEPKGDDANRRPPRVVFAPSADEWLVRSTRGCARPDEIAVVTSDRKLAGRCRHAGASVVRPRDFLAHCPSGQTS